MTAAATRAVSKIVVRIVVGKDRMAGTDDPLFLCVAGPCGREFRLSLAKGHGLRRGATDIYVLGSARDKEINLENPEFNDPTAPPIDLHGVQAVNLRKGLNPIPNVRGIGEMDDRLQIESVEVEFYVEGESEAHRYHRAGPIWLGLICGLSLSLEPVGGIA